ncbi:MAG: hypothetical protein K0S29_519 [Gammaproteobacteria bacterium]|jgi:hypothetical protein|nr:hypothetical protein [Gammaproteobacteria bacterium]
MRYFQASLTVILSFSAAMALAAEQNVIWTTVFTNVQPANSQVTQAYCNSHTPNVAVSTIDQFVSKQGVNAKNGINVRYNAYKSVNYDNLYFNFATVTISGSDQSGAWSSKMKLYEQTIAPDAATYSVWSTPYCKGTMLGTPHVTASS